MIFTKRELAWHQDQKDKDFDFDAVTVPQIVEYFRGHSDGDVCLCEFGIDFCRFDLIKVNCHKQRVRIFEFKTSRADFEQDKKWENYLKYCNTLTFVSPYKLIKKEELPKEIGLLYVFKWRWLKWEGWKIGAMWERTPRGRKLGQEIYIRIISLLLNRAKWRKGEIF